ncbi:hypothetical protein [Limnoglobus roseus]|uniref:hypothetical protein n=1 Tax=Limnoglobus roseus TaxID=2598579 RepID=UPI0011EB522E|nr:hypothetical protein [Limnoglobus roseus]
MTSIAFKPLDSLTVDEAVREIGALFSLSAVVVTRAAQLYRWLADRGAKVELRSQFFKKMVPLVARGEVSEEAVAEFAEDRRVLSVVSQLDVAEQVRLRSPLRHRYPRPRREEKEAGQAPEAGEEMTPPDGEFVFVLVLRPVADPQAGPGVPPRDPDYRLKLALKTLLRAFGLRCVAVRNPQSSDPTPNEEPTP